MLGCKDFAPAALQACLQAADPNKILEVQDGVTNAGLAFLPVVDGDMLPDMPMVCFSSVFSLFLPEFPLSSAADFFFFFFRIFSMLEMTGSWLAVSFWNIVRKKY